MLPDPIFTGRSQAPAPGGVAGSDRTPTLPPSAFADLAAWYRFGMGITVTGAGVSQWNDASGNGRHLLQGTDAARPPLQADGTVLFDGVAQFLQTSGFTLNQPETVYILCNQVSYAVNRVLLDGSLAATMRLLQGGSVAGQLYIRLTSTVGDNTDAALPIGTYGVIACVFNGVASAIQVDNRATTTGDVGATNASGFTVGANGSGAAFANIRVKEVIVCNTAHDGTRRAQMLAWLRSL